MKNELPESIVDLTLDQLFELIRKDKEDMERLRELREQQKEQRQSLLAELRKRGLSVSEDFYK